MDRMRSTQ